MEKAGTDTTVKCRKSGVLVLLLYTREFVAVELKKLSTSTHNLLVANNQKVFFIIMNEIMKLN